jgi:hypothetical protein
MRTKTTNATRGKDAHQELVRNLYFGLSDAHRAVSTLKGRCRFLREQLLILDAVSNQDEPVDEATWKALTDDKCYSPTLQVFSVINALRASLDLVKNAQDLAADRIKGEAKENAARRLEQHKVETEKLLQFFQGLRSELEKPQTASRLRHDDLGELIDSCRAAVELVQKTINGVNEPAVGEEMYSAVMAEETKLLRIEAELNRLRDNRRLKTGRTIAACLGHLTETERSLLSLKNQALELCTENGIVIYNRAGPVNPKALTKTEK